MNKSIVKTILFFLILGTSNRAIAQLLPMEQFAEIALQDSLRAILYRVEVAELNKKPQNGSSGFDLGERFYYQGDLLNAVSRLTRVSRARIKVIGQVPDVYISYWGERFNSDLEGKGRKVVKPKPKKNPQYETLNVRVKKITDYQNQGQNDPANHLVLTTLETTYGFSVTDIEDTCEVWVAKVFNKEKLNGFLNMYPQDMHHGSGSTTKNNKCYFELNSYELSNIWGYVEIRSKHMIYDEIEDKRRFSMSLECDEFTDFNKINAVLGRFGLGIIKEKRLERLKLITFFE
jgi:hypothetical protein